MEIMKGLLIRDFYVLKKGAASIIGLFFIYAVIAGFQENSFFVWFLGIFAGMLPLNIMSFDERSKWETLAGTMPYSPFQLAVSKYIFSLLAVLLAAAIYAAVNSCLVFFASVGTYGGLLRNIPVILVIGFGFSALELPFLFRLGVSKGRIIFIVSTMLICALASFFVINRAGISGADSLAVRISGDVFSPGTVVVMLVLMAVSAAISVKIYKGKEF